jgi:uncharacterized protein (UPF0264 family)
VSVALGELREWVAGEAGRDAGPGAARAPQGPDPARFRGFAFRKMGLAGAGARWEEVWGQIRRLWGTGPSWVAVVYSDWERADAPRPERVLDVALASNDCAGVLFDTWDKSRPTDLDLSQGCRRWFDRVRAAGLLTALAGGLDVESITRLAPLHPDIVAVRGAACYGGDRLAAIDPQRVASLVRAAAAI